MLNAVLQLISKCNLDFQQTSGKVAEPEIKSSLLKRVDSKIDLQMPQMRFKPNPISKTDSSAWFTTPKRRVS